MKYAFMGVGLMIFLVGVQCAVNGARDGWDAAVAAAPIMVGIVVAAIGFVVWFYEWARGA